MQSEARMPGHSDSKHRRLTYGRLVLPMAGVMVMNEMRSRECDDPQTDDKAADGKDPSARGAVMHGQGRRFAGAEDLAADANAHEKSAENEGEPRHNLPFYSIGHGCGKGQSWTSEVGFLVQGRRARDDSRGQIGRIRRVRGIRTTALLAALAIALVSTQVGRAQNGPAPPGDDAEWSEPGPQSVAVEPMGEMPAADRAGMDGYMRILVRTTKEHWIKVLPQSARLPLAKQGIVTIEFVLPADGRPANMTLLRSSGDVALDRAAWAAITGSSYAPFPAGVSMPQVKLRVHFNYNEKVQDDTRP